MSALAKEEEVMPDKKKTHLLEIPQGFVSDIIKDIDSNTPKDDAAVRRAEHAHCMGVWKTFKAESDKLYAEGKHTKTQLKEMYRDKDFIELNYRTTMAIIKGLDDNSEDKVSKTKKKVEAMKYGDEVDLYKYESAILLPAINRVNARIPEKYKYYPCLQVEYKKKQDKLKDALNSVGESYVKLKLI